MREPLASVPYLWMCCSPAPILLLSISKKVQVLRLRCNITVPKECSICVGKTDIWGINEWDGKPIAPFVILSALLDPRISTLTAPFPNNIINNISINKNKNNNYYYDSYNNYNYNNHDDCWPHPMWAKPLLSGCTLSQGSHRSPRPCQTAYGKRRFHVERVYCGIIRKSETRDRLSNESFCRW